MFLRIQLSVLLVLFQSASSYAFVGEGGQSPSGVMTEEQRLSDEGCMTLIPQDPLLKDYNFFINITFDGYGGAYLSVLDLPLGEGVSITTPLVNARYTLKDGNIRIETDPSTFHSQSGLSFGSVFRKFKVVLTGSIKDEGTLSTDLIIENGDAMVNGTTIFKYTLD